MEMNYWKALFSASEKLLELKSESQFEDGKLIRIEGNDPDEVLTDVFMELFREIFKPVIKTMFKGELSESDFLNALGIAAFADKHSESDDEAMGIVFGKSIKHACEESKEKEKETEKWGNQAGYFGITRSGLDVVITLVNKEKLLVGYIIKPSAEQYKMLSPGLQNLKDEAIKEAYNKHLSSWASGVLRELKAIIDECCEKFKLFTMSFAIYQPDTIDIQTGTMITQPIGMVFSAATAYFFKDGPAVFFCSYENLERFQELHLPTIKKFLTDDVSEENKLSFYAALLLCFASEED